MEDNWLMQFFRQTNTQVIAAILTFIGAWYWLRKNRGLKKSDDQESATRLETRKLADDLAQVDKQKALKLEMELKVVVDRVIFLEKEIIELKTKTGPFWSFVQAKIIKDLDHPSPQFAEMDRLLHRLFALTITPSERRRLEVLRGERVLSCDPEVSEDEKDSAILLELVMKKVLIEAGHPAD